MTSVERSETFHPCDTTAALSEAARRFLDGRSTVIPFLAAGRPDLRASAVRAEELYGTTRVPEPADTGLDLLGDDAAADAVRVLLRPLARVWTTDPKAASGARSVLICGLYQDLSSQIVAPLMGFSAPRPGVAVLTGRDLASVSWMIAKQYARVRPDVTRQALLTSQDVVDAPPEDVEVLSYEDFQTRDIRGFLSSSPWRRLQFQSHGKDQVLLLGDWALSGVSDVDAPEGPVTLRPRFGYGYPDPENKLAFIRFSQFTAAELILNSCHSGPFPDTGSYAVRYQMVLAAVDGTAQTVVAAVTNSNAGMPESARFLAQHDPDEDMAAVLNASIADVNPYGVFLRHGVQAEPNRPAAAVGAGDRRQRETDRLLALSLDRAVGWAESGLLPADHPSRTACARFLKKYTRLLCRTSSTESERIHAQLVRDLAALDRSIAARIAADPDDPMMDYPDYWADRSVVCATPEPVACGTCGDIAQKFVRTGKSRVIPDVEVVGCLRCGDGDYRPAHAPAVITRSPVGTYMGASVSTRLDVSQARPGTVHYGLYTPPYLTDYGLDSPLRSTAVGEDGTFTDRFTLTLGPSVVPQMYYYTVYVVQDLGINVARHNLGVRPVPAGS
ncbi:MULTISPECIES: hypothetical protein [unclassified Streptomyces]|uniref:hypothetical protein n=1 Tax=unclassified Streptomyces TaxID=2593676 RepID=UPI000933EC87|nr:hypothetical protein [Streptomyces sp. NBRC 110465]